MAATSVRNVRSRSSKVVHFGTNRKRMCDFLLLINSNLGPLLPRFRNIAGFLLKTALHSYSTRIFGTFPLEWIADDRAITFMSNITSCITDISFLIAVTVINCSIAVLIANEFRTKTRLDYSAAEKG